MLELALEGININTMDVTSIQMKEHKDTGDVKRARDNARVTIKRENLLKLIVTNTF